MKSKALWAVLQTGYRAMKETFTMRWCLLYENCYITLELQIFLCCCICRTLQTLLHCCGIKNIAGPYKHCCNCLEITNILYLQDFINIAALPCNYKIILILYIYRTLRTLLHCACMWTFIQCTCMNTGTDLWTLPSMKLWLLLHGWNVIINCLNNCAVTLCFIH